MDRDHRPLFAREDDLVADVAKPVEEQIELRDVAQEALEIVAKLPPRLRRVAELRAAGFTYEEIGEITGDSKNRVAQLAALADDRINEIRAERAPIGPRFRPVPSACRETWPAKRRPAGMAARRWRSRTTERQSAVMGQIALFSPDLITGIRQAGSA